MAFILFVVPFIAAAENEPPGNRTPVIILALGDSLTVGLGVDPADAFPVQLESYLRRRGVAVRVRNAGVSGDTSAGGLARLDWALAANSDSAGPDLAIIELGANDGLRGLDPMATRENLDRIIVKLKARGVVVLLTGMKAPPNYGAAFSRAFNGLYPDLAEKHGVAFYPFFLDGVAADPTLNQKDAIHPNARGVAVIVERMAPTIQKLIESGLNSGLVGE